MSVLGGGNFNVIGDFYSIILGVGNPNIPISSVTIQANNITTTNYGIYISLTINTPQIGL